MARPINKEQLVNAGNENFKKLFDLIHSLSKSEQEMPFSFHDRDKNIRDVLVHLYEWHQLLLHWISLNKAGNKTNFLPEPYNWKTYPELNVDFWRKHQNTLLKRAIDLLNKSHEETVITIDSFSNEELFTKKYFTWTGTTSLGSYCISATSSHYDWAIKKIRKHKKELKG
jgi:hypothetical protein